MNSFTMAPSRLQPLCLGVVQGWPEDGLKNYAEIMSLKSFGGPSLNRGQFWTWLSILEMSTFVTFCYWFRKKSPMGRIRWSHRRIVEECQTLSSYRVKEWRGRIQKIEGTEVLPLSYYVGDELVSYSVELDTTHCNYGGKRYWFPCPICKKRVAKIYLPPKGKYFACRTCNYLT